MSATEQARTVRDELAGLTADQLRSMIELRDARIAQQQEQYERLWRSYDQLKEELALVKRRLFVATAERVDTKQLQMEFAALTQELKKRAKEDELKGDEKAEENGSGGEGKPNGTKKPKAKGHQKPSGRRKLEDTGLPEVPVEVSDPLFEELVAQGKAERIGFEESSKLGYQQAGLRRVVIRRVKYRATRTDGAAEIETAQVPPEVIPRCLAAPSTLAIILISKYCDGLPLYRVEQLFERWGFALDRGTMSRWVEQLGATFGATVIEAWKKQAFATAFCIMTDATGFAIQPGASEDGSRRACRKGHYFVQIVDRDHIFFEYTPKETSATVRAMFKGFEGYIQADAKSVYDVLFRPSGPEDIEDDGCIRLEVSCWSHARRKFWEAAFSKDPVAHEALLRIAKIFEMDERCRKDNPPSKIKALRQKHVAPLVHDFLAFAADAYARHKNERGSLRSALGYCFRQREGLGRFLEDGRLRMDNNPSESALRKVVLIRDVSLFAGSDDHAQSAGHVLSLIATAKLHRLEPHAYIRDLIRVLPHWPRDRYLELAPPFWGATRARLDLAQLERELGVLDVPERLSD